MTKIMILGTFHMGNTSDLYSVDTDNLRSTKRQEEIRKVVDAIKEFHPNKIALEVEKEKNHLLNEEYHQYLNNVLELAIDEIHQFGFRAAAELKHKEVYAIDWMENVGNRSIGEVMNWAEKEQTEVFQLIDTYRSKLILPLDEKRIDELIRSLNEEKYIIKQHEMYMHIARIGRGIDYVGIDWMRWWYQRNLILFANLAEISSSNDRVLLIIGAAHVHLVAQFLKESGLFEIVSVSEFL
ncbi:DUF5694 domain-containing protein [Psychrobacillus sp. MER TA 171]|uniref:DUF5694 domain-containing protein n=1 Tax=Psychrobacillus sp. MER TA 171 TaxID=2939577 RepID=UPI00203C6C96|nr:DUF5694 domain-containing protein [Psychrobacillus sp. MER TA 171]MCM3357373.1 DUF5694 domain-containing protein [Psychrobacillus sp. MER TA 171]